MIAAVKRLHFSWGYLIFSIIWGLCSYAVFCDYTVRLLNETQELVTASPWASSEWVTKGEAGNFSNCLAALCIDSESNARSSMERFVDVDKTQLQSADFFLVALSVNMRSTNVQQSNAQSVRQSDIEINKQGKKKKKRLSLLLVSALDDNNQLMSFVLPPVYLDNIGNQILWRKMSAIHPQTETLRIVIISRTVGQWTINNLSVQTVTFSLLYKLLRWLVFCGWILSLIWLVQRLLSRVNRATKAIAAIVVCLMVSVGIGGDAPAILAKLTNIFNAFKSEVGLDVNKWKISWQPLLHFIAHCLLTLYFYKQRALLQLTTFRIVLLNAGLAIGVECVQLGVPGRTSETGDVALAMAGVLGGIIVFQLISRAQRRVY